jgi:hypothetical protein
MKNISLILIIFLTWSATCLRATPAENLFTQANTEFVSGNYNDAIRDYELLLKQKNLSAAVFYNLANAYFRNGKVGHAVLNYERALWINPSDADEKANLQFVRKSSGLFESSAPWWKAFSRTLSLNSWCWLSFTLLVVACSLITYWFIRPQWNIRPILITFLFLFTVTTSGAFLRFLDLDRAVILSSEAPVKVAPVAQSPSQFTLVSGSIVEIQKERDSFAYIRSEDGKTGWISKDDFEPIVKETF